MSTANRYLCGVPDEHCTGGELKTDQALQHKKCHTSPQEAFKCHVRYLINVLGFKRLGAREFINPESGYVRVLPKSTRFGGRLRSGKGEDNRITKSRFQPDTHDSRGIIY